MAIAILYSTVCVLYRARLCKRFRRPGIDSKETIPQADVAWWAGTSNRVVGPTRQGGNRFLGSLKVLQIRAQYSVIILDVIRDFQCNFIPIGPTVGLIKEDI